MKLASVLTRATQIVFALICLSGYSAAAQTPADAAPVTAEARFSYDAYLVVPVRVHLLGKSQTRAAVTTLTERDISRISTKANAIWHAAGIHLRIESIVTERPASIAGIARLPSIPTEALRSLRPTASRDPNMFHVYFIGEMEPNGIFMGRDAIFVKETARLRPVAGGIDEPLPRVMAHEIGHGMGLPHRQAVYNLMASGTTGTSLNESEIETVRRTVTAFTWVKSPADLLKEALRDETDHKRAKAQSMFHALVQIPGDSPVKRRAVDRIMTK